MKLVKSTAILLATSAMLAGCGGGGLFNVPAEKVGKIKVVTVCLEHGKIEPNSRVVYELRPIESFTS